MTSSPTPADLQPEIDLLTSPPPSTHASDSPFYSLPQTNGPTTTVSDADSTVESLDTSASSMNGASIVGEDADPTIATGFDFSGLTRNPSLSVVDNATLPENASAADLAIITATSKAFLSSAQGATPQYVRPETEDVAFPISASSTPTSPHAPSSAASSANASRKSSIASSGTTGTGKVASSASSTSTAAVPPIAASSAPPSISRLAASGSTDNLFANTEKEAPSPQPISGGNTQAKQTASGAASASTTRGIFTRLFNPFGGSNNIANTNVNPNPSPSASPTPAPTGPVGNVPGGMPTISIVSHNATPAASGATATNPPVNAAPIPVVIPKTYSYQDFAAKMKLPAAQDLVKTLKNYVKHVQAPEWMSKHTAEASAAAANAQSNPKSATPAAPQTEFDRIRAEYNELITNIMKSIRTKHPLWKGCSEEELDNSLESIEKFLTSKLYDRFFGLFPQDRIKDTILTEKLFILHTWVRPHHLDLPTYCCTDTTIWDHPAEELRNMDKFKSPRDKLVCLLNCCHIINNILKRAKQKQNQEKLELAETKRKARAERQEKEKQRVKQVEKDAAAATNSTDLSESLSVVVQPATSTDDKSTPPSTPPHRASLEGEIDTGFTPSSSPSADDFFPALIYTLIHAKPPHLYLNLTYISLCRYESKLNGGEAAYWYTNLASAIQFLDVLNEKSFSFGPAALKNPTQAKKEYDSLMQEGQRLWDDEVQRKEQELEAATKKSEDELQAKKLAATEQEEASAAALAAVNAAANMTETENNETVNGTMDATTQPSDTVAANPSLPTANGSPIPSPTHLHHNHGASSWNIGSASGGVVNVAPHPLPPPCVACLQLSHRRVPTHFLDREFSSLTIGELQDVLREYKELCFVLQGWQETASHKEMRSMPLPQRHASQLLDGQDDMTLTGTDANSAAPTNAAVAASTIATSSSSIAPAAQAATSGSRGWPLTNFLGLGRGGK